MAEVFRAKLRGVAGFERIFAVKLILPEIARDSQFVTMFLDEARIAARLNHPNIVQTLDLGISEGDYFIAMEYIEGVDIRTLLKRCKETGASVPRRHACRIVAEVCEALSYAHNKRDARGGRMNVVHRDVSPPNVLLSHGGDVKLIDFGVAKATHRSAKTRTGILKGKVAYLAPEQILGLPADHRSDIFAAGVLLWELLANDRLFQGITDFAILEQIRVCAHDRVSVRNPSVPAELDDIVEKALARDPDDRYQDSIELHDRLREYMMSSGEHSGARSVATWMKRLLSNEPAFEDEPPTLRRARTVLRKPPKKKWKPRTNRNVIRRVARGTPRHVTPIPEVAAEPSTEVLVSFESTPPGARVYVVSNGIRRKIGTTPVQASLDRSTDCDVSIRKHGYTTWNSHLAFGKRESLSVSADLEKKLANATTRTS